MHSKSQRPPDESASSLASPSPRTDSRPGDSAAPRCPKCEGSGVLFQTDGTLAICDCGALAMGQIRERLRRARIPPRFAKKTLDSFLARDAQRKRLLQTARAYVSGFHLAEENYGLLLTGVTGAGKTHLAIGILREVIEKGHSGLYCNVTDLLSRLRATYDENSDEAELDVIDECIECDLLVLDDLGSESTTEWVLDRLYLIINRRYESMRPLIVTTNCSENDLNEKVGQRIISRICEMCKPFASFPQEDYRRKGLL